MKTLPRLILLFLISFAGIILMASSSSPLLPDALYDDATFTIIADAWRHGKIPYSEIFDNKGPLLYLLYIIGQTIAIGQWGLCIIETSFATASLELLYRIGRSLRTSRPGNLLAILIAFISYILFVDWGNTVEEFSLPFQLLPLLLILKPTTKPKSLGLIIGLCFGATALIRLNNNTIILAIILYWIFRAFFSPDKKETGSIIPTAISFLIGLVVAMAPFIIYFACVGALGDFLYCNYVYNVFYKFNWPQTGSILFNIIYLLPCILLPIVAIAAGRSTVPANKQFTPLFILISVITFLVFFTGTGYLHYFLMTVPLGAITLQLLAPEKQTNSIPLKALYIVALVVLILPLAFNIASPHRHAKNIYNALGTPSDYEVLTDGIAHLIPPQARSSVYIYDCPEALPVCVRLGIIPAGRFFYYQPEIAKVHTSLQTDITKAFEEAHPAWIISGNDLADPNVLGPKAASYRLVNRMTFRGNTDLYFYRRLPLHQNPNSPQ